MFAVYLTKEDKITYRVYCWLRNEVPNVRIETLRQISFYIAQNYHDLDVINHLNIKYNDAGNLELTLNDDILIEFSDGSEHFGFVIKHNIENISMITLVSSIDAKDLSTVYVMGYVSSVENGIYMITSRLGDSKDDKTAYGVIDYYCDKAQFLTYWDTYKNGESLDLITNKNSHFNLNNRSYFNISLYEQVDLDCFNGYVTEVLSRIDLLGNNLKILDNKLVRVKGE